MHVHARTGETTSGLFCLKCEKLIFFKFLQSLLKTFTIRIEMDVLKVFKNCVVRQICSEKIIRVLVVKEN